ncbi:MAG: RNA polymerase sigma factor [Polyangiaceae bacterium]
MASSGETQTHLEQGTPVPLTRGTRMEETSKRLAGDRLSLRAVVALESGFILRALHTHGVYSRDQDDAAQEVLWAVQQGLATFDASRARDPRRALHSWLLSICQRIAANHRRRSARRAEDLADEENLPNEPGNILSPTEQAWFENENARLVRILLDRIPEERAAVVRAYDLEETPMDVVARMLGIPVNTGWNRRRLGLRDLRAALERRAAIELRASLFAAHNDAASFT